MHIKVRMSHRGGCGCEPNTGDGAGNFADLKFFTTRANRNISQASLLECRTHITEEF